MLLNDFKTLMDDQDAVIYGLLYKDEVVDASIAACSRELKCIIIMEELAELQQMVSKFARGEIDDKDTLLEEMADVKICVDMLMKLANVESADLTKATGAKLFREGIRRGVFHE